MNRIRQSTDPEAPRPDAGDYFVVDAQHHTWYVSTEMAQFLESVLDAEVRPVWVSFIDLSGSRVRVRSSLINAVSQCTAAQREMERSFSRALNRERKADRDWSEDE